jgi:hypothetical protein
MVGFIKNLFGSKSEDNDSGEQPKRKRQKAFYLDPDEAKTYGDIDYMRQPNQTRKSFPKTLGNPEGGEIVEEVSALEKKSLSKPNQKQQNVTQQSQSPDPVVDPGELYSAKDDPTVQKRRESDSSLDMFRNMARDIKKD